MEDAPAGPLGAGSDPTRGRASDLTRATAPGTSFTSDIPHPTSHIPTRIGRYTIVRVLGEGGMGTVYEAQQDNPKRTVALKVIKAGYLSPALLRRFEQESQVLGRLQHPGIAQVYEAGVVDSHADTDSHADDESSNRRASSSASPSVTPSLRHSVTSASPIPFFAMEFIRGIPLTDYATQKTLSTRDRLELLAKVCDAVYHAHQKGVIHRDLKPGNILVDDSGQPKILDFGVARATDSDIQQTTIQTDIGQLIGTVPYMSPEQVGGDPDDLDTRSDVYALGVIAYELLAGRLPYDLQRKMIHEAARIIKEEEPTRLSSISRTLRGDIETIVAHALEKDKTRRYQSAESLASDIRRYLNDEPIAARPASTWYQATKFAKRNTGLVTGLAAAFVLLIAGLIGTGYGLRQAITARDSERAARTEAEIQKNAALAAKESEAIERKAAEAQRDKAEKIAEFMSDTLEGAGPSVALGRDITMLKEMMDAAAARIEKGDLASAPEAELRLRGTIGNTYRELAQFDNALRLIEPSLDLARSLHEGDHPDVALSLTNLAVMRKSMGRAAEAEPLYEQAFEMSRRLFPGDHPSVATSLNNLAGVRDSLGRVAEAEPLYVQALEMNRRLFSGDHEDVATSLNNLAGVRKDLGRAAEAEPLFEQALEMYRRLFQGDHPYVANSLNSLAVVRESLGRAAEAEPLYEQALEMSRRLFPGDHPSVERSLNNLALVRESLGRAAEAEPLFEQALEMSRRLFPGDHPSVATSLNNLAFVRQSLGRAAEAEPLYEQALEMSRRLFPGDHPSVAGILTGLANVRQSLDRAAEAEPLHQQALEMYRRLFQGDHPYVANSLNSLASVRLSLGRAAEAEPLFSEAVEMSTRQVGKGHPSTLLYTHNLASLLIRSGRHAEAAPLVEECVEGRTKKFGAAHKQTRAALGQAVTLYESWDKAEPGKGYGAKAAEWKAKLDAVTPPPEPAKPTDPPPK